MKSCYSLKVGVLIIWSQSVWVMALHERQETSGTPEVELTSAHKLVDGLQDLQPEASIPQGAAAVQAQSKFFHSVVSCECRCRPSMSFAIKVPHITTLPSSSVGTAGVKLTALDFRAAELIGGYFRDFFSVQLSPHKMEFGHVCEDPHSWEQRYEHKDYKNHRDMGKVRWGDKNGGYGEHYWDLNHAGGPEQDDSQTESSEENADYDEYEKETHRNKRTPPSNQQHNYSKKSQKQPAPYTDQQIYPRKERNYDNDDIVEPINPKPQKPILGPDQAFTNQPRLTQARINPKPGVYNLNDAINHALSPASKNPRTIFPTQSYGVPFNHYSAWSNPNEQKERDPFYGNNPGTTLYIDESTGHIIDQATGKAYYLSPVIL